MIYTEHCAVNGCQKTAIGNDTLYGVQLLIFLVKIFSLNPCTHRVCMSQFSMDVFSSFLSYQVLSILKDRGPAMLICVYLWLYWNNLWQRNVSSRAFMCLRVFVPYCSYMDGVICKFMNRQVTEIGKTGRSMILLSKLGCDSLQSLWLWLLTKVQASHGKNVKIWLLI